MIKSSDTIQSRPDGVLLVIAYYLLLGVSFLLGALMVLITTLPVTWKMAAADSLYIGGVVSLVITLAAGGVMGLWMLLCARGLWLSKRTARTATIVLSGVMAAVSILSIPALLFSFDDASMIRLSLIAVAIVIAVISGWIGWYLTRPMLKSYYESIA